MEEKTTSTRSKKTTVRKKAAKKKVTKKKVTKKAAKKLAPTSATASKKEAKTAGKKKTARKPSLKKQSQETTAIVISEFDRQKMIAEAAYYRAEQRGFAAGDPLEDWLAAETEVDSILSQQTP